MGGWCILCQAHTTRLSNSAFVGKRIPAVAREGPAVPDRLSRSASLAAGRLLDRAHRAARDVAQAFLDGTNGDRGSSGEFSGPSETTRRLGWTGQTLAAPCFNAVYAANGGMRAFPVRSSRQNHVQGAAPD